MMAQGWGKQHMVCEWTHLRMDEGRQAWPLRPGEPRSSCCPQGAGQMGTGGSRGFSDLGPSPGLLLCCLWWAAPGLGPGGLQFTVPTTDHLCLEDAVTLLVLLPKPWWDAEKP